MQIKDLYAIGMQSDTAYSLMRELCDALGLDSLPTADDERVVVGKTSLDIFVEQVSQQP